MTMLELCYQLIKSVVHNSFLMFIYFYVNQIKFLPDNSNFGKYLSLRASGFASSSETGSQVHIVFGLKMQNLDDCHKTDPKCFGKPTWDEKFNLNSALAQQKLLVSYNYN